MPFRVHAVVDNPSVELCRLMAERGVRRAPSGRLAVPLLQNRPLSHDAYPGEWQPSDTIQYRPDFSSGVVRIVYHFPEELAEAGYRLQLHATEVHLRGSYCQVATGYNGEQLRPYRREGDRGARGQYTHPTISHFSGLYLGMLRLDANAARRVGLMVVQRAKVGVYAGRVTVTVEQLFCLDDPRLATCKLQSLPPEAAAWNDALRAHYERWECDRTVCDGHYHL